MSRLRGFFLMFGLLGCLVPGVPRAQVPDSDIWIADLSPAFGGHPLRLGVPVNVTQRPGYDNQPAFLYKRDSYGTARGHSVSIQRFADPQVGFLYTSADSLGVTDIFRWDPYTKTSERVTHTPESEYSPTPFGIAGGGGPAGFDVVRVEADGTQRLWRFDIDGSNPRLVMSDVDSVGYFAWIDNDHLVAFVLGNETRKEPHTLRVVDVRAQKETIVARDIGRAIHRMPNGQDISFTVHEDDDTYRFMKLSREQTTPHSLIDAVGQGQDAAWIGVGPTLLMSSGAAIYATTFGRKMEPAGWRLVADFSGAGITSISRITVSPDQNRFAFVATASAP